MPSRVGLHQQLLDVLGGPTGQAGQHRRGGAGRPGRPPASRSSCSRARAAVRAARPGSRPRCRWWGGRRSRPGPSARRRWSRIAADRALPKQCRRGTGRRRRDCPRCARATTALSSCAALARATAEHVADQDRAGRRPAGGPARSRARGRRPAGARPRCASAGWLDRGIAGPEGAHQQQRARLGRGGQLLQQPQAGADRPTACRPGTAPAAGPAAAKAAMKLRHDAGEAVLGVGGPQLGHGRLRADDQRQLGDQIDDQPPVAAQRGQQALPPEPRCARRSR